MTSSALEEKINKIRQQNEEIRRRHQEVEEDKKNAAKLNALVQMVPSTDWPERKEPPEFSDPLVASNKPKVSKDHHPHSQQYHSAGSEGRKSHVFAQGQGPPPDPKYNFLADSEREEGNVESMKNSPPIRGQKTRSGMFRRKQHGGRDGMQRDYRTSKGPHRDERQPEYEAWRAERNRIDEDRISRQRTAEGNWRREWDNDKTHLLDDVSKLEAKLGNYLKKDHKQHINGSDYTHHNRGGNPRSYRGNSRHFHNNYENRSSNVHYQDGQIKTPSHSIDDRTVIATDKSLKVTLNQGNTGKGQLMSVKVNSPSIAGTGRVGPRQRSRITYSSHSDVEVASAETDSSCSKSYEDKNKSIYHDNLQRSSNSQKSQPRRKDIGNKSPYLRKKEIKEEDAGENPFKYHETELKSPHVQKECEESQELYQSKSQNVIDAKPLQDDEAVTHTHEKENNVTNELDTKDTEYKNRDNHNDALDIQLNVDEAREKVKSHLVSKDTDLPVFESGTEIKKCTVVTIENKSDETQIVQKNADLPVFEVEVEIGKCTIAMENKSDEAQIIQAATFSKCEETKTDLVVPLMINADDNDRTESILNSSNDTNDNIEEIAEENKEQNEEIANEDCDSNQNKDESEQNDDIKYDIKDSTEEKEADTVISSSSDVCSVAKENNELESENKVLRKTEILIAENEIATIDEKIDKQDRNVHVNEIQERISENDDEKSNPIQVTL